MLDFDLKNINDVIENMVNKKLTFTYIPKKDSWDKLLIPSKSQYQEELNTI
jgi:hypothetical protein